MLYEVITMTLDFDVNAITESPILDFFSYFGEDTDEIPAHLKPLSEFENREEVE